MSVIANWYITTANDSTFLHWWSKGATGPGVTKGKDYAGREGNFSESTFALASWQRDGDILTFTGHDGRRALATMGTHYKNPKYPAQCVAGWEQLEAQLAGVRRI